MTNLPLELTKDPMSVGCVAALRRLEFYDCDRINRMCREKYGWSGEEAKDNERITKKFLSLNILDPSVYHIPTQVADDYWHRMILDTKWYTRFCDDIFGSFLHHTPMEKTQQKDEFNRDRSLRAAKYWFGEGWGNLVRTCTQCKGPEPNQLSTILPRADMIMGY